MIKKVKNAFLEEKEFKKHLAKIEDPNYEGETNFALPENPTHEQKIKYKICKEILRYQRINKLTDKEIADMIDLSEHKTENILYCHIEEFTLDQLEYCISKLPILTLETPIIVREKSYYPVCFIPSIQK